MAIFLWYLLTALIAWLIWNFLELIIVNCGTFFPSVVLLTFIFLIFLLIVDIVAVVI